MIDRNDPKAASGVFKYERSDQSKGSWIIPITMAGAAMTLACIVGVAISGVWQ